MREDACISLLLKAMEDPNWRVRKTAVEILFDDYPVNKYIHGLTGLLFIEDNAGPRNAAIESLVRLGKEAVPFLVEAFSTPNKDVRKFIIDILGEQSDPRSLPLMIEAIRDEDQNVRAAAVEHLGKLREPSVTNALIEILDGEDLWTAYPAADALGRIGHSKAVPHLVRALERKALREPVLKALGLISDKSALGSVVSLLTDPSRNIREQALIALEKFYRNGVDAAFIVAEVKRVHGEQTLEILIDLLRSGKREAKLSAVVLLGLMKDEAAYVPLLEISQEEEFAEEVKKSFVGIGKEKPESLLGLFHISSAYQLRLICEVAGEIISPVYFNDLSGMLEHADGHVRSSAALSIAKLNDSRAVEKLEKLLVDRYEDVQEAAVKALSSLKEWFRNDNAVRMLGSGNVVIRKNAARLLGMTGAEEDVMDLGFTLKDENASVRKAAVEALSMIGTEEAKKYLIRALTDEDPDIRIASALSLGGIGGEDVLNAVIILSTDPDNFVRAAAAKSLGLTRNRDAVPSLIGLLGDVSGFVVTSAIESLGAIGGDEARQAIISKLASDDIEIKRTAILALASFEDIRQHLTPFLEDPDWATRIAAVRSLGGRAESGTRRDLEKLLDSEEDPTVIKAIEETLRV
jgi:HEAT repeat protein